MGKLPKHLDAYGALYLFGQGDAHMVAEVEQALHTFPHLSAVWIEGSYNHPRCKRLTQEVDLKTLAWESLFLKPLYISLNKEGELFFSKLQEVQKEVELFASEYQDLGEVVLGNFLDNLPLISCSKWGPSLQGQGKGLTAVVCGGGPSLEAMLPLLKNIHDQVLIIAGGSAISALNAHGITPHLMTGVDPDPSWSRFLEQTSFTSPFLYQSRFSSSQLKSLCSPLIFFPGSGTTPFEDYVLPEMLPWDTGWSVVNFSTAIACLLGCKKIVWAGVDFCSKKNKLYAKGVSQESEETLSCETAHPDLFTKKDWIASRDWMLRLVEQHPEVEWVRGPSLDDKITRSLREVKEEELTSLEKRDLTACVHRWVEQLPPPPLTTHCRKQIDSSLQQSLSLCDELLSVWQRSHPALPFELPEFTLLEQALHEEISYLHYLLPLWQVWRFPLLRHETSLPGKKLHELLFFKNTLQRIVR